jgi:hypothetical protein
MSEKFNLFLSSGEPLYEKIVEYSKRDDLNIEAFYLQRFITEAKDQVQVEYHYISEQNKTNEDKTGIVIKGPSYKFTMVKTNKEDNPYIVTESRSINVGGTDLCQLPTNNELFPGQYTITFITGAELRNDVMDLFRNLV